jgi:hypothetical protein
MRFIVATLQTGLDLIRQIFNRWLPKAGSHFEFIKSIKIMYIHGNGVILTSIFALMANKALNHDASLAD